MLRGSSVHRTKEPVEICPLCGKEISTFAPKGGDGTLRYFRRHKGKDGSEHWLVEVPTGTKK